MHTLRMGFYVFWKCTPKIYDYSLKYIFIASSNLNTGCNKKMDLPSDKLPPFSPFSRSIFDKTRQKQAALCKEEVAHSDSQIF